MEVGEVGGDFECLASLGVFWGGDCGFDFRGAGDGPEHGDKGEDEGEAEGLEDGIAWLADAEEAGEGDDEEEGEAGGADAHGEPVADGGAVFVEEMEDAESHGRGARSDGCGDFLKEFCDELAGVCAGEFGFRGEDEAVCDDVNGEVLDGFRGDEFAALEEGDGLGDFHEGK